MTSLTHARVLRIAGPIMLANATIPAMGAGNRAVIGQLGQAAPMGAVSLGAVVLATLYWAFGFLRMSTPGLAAQAHGAGNRAERRAGADVDPSPITSSSRAASSVAASETVAAMSGRL